jgi:twinkle protein
MERPEHTLTQGELRAADDWIDEMHRFIVPIEDEDVDLAWVLKKMSAAVIQHGCRIVVIDPWNEMDHCRDHDESLTEYVGRAIKAFKRFARTMQVHLILVAHPTKQKKENGEFLMPSLYDISDSAHFYNKADLGVVVHRNGDGDSIIKTQKSRYHEILGEPGAVLMAYGKDTRHFVEMERL